MIDKLLTFGFVHVDGEVQANALYEIYKSLKGKGHALHYAEETRDGKILGASAYHYTTCVVCHPDRRLP
jgi:hypothetical protein